ncbi:MAG: hypothetical protein GF365_05130 [Candidatus Buchananbacteria bacterium]|nr:hypothetical protein [Candidatus Buchananbacteria bacterium]
MSNKLNGTIMIGGFGPDNIGRKVFDLKITNSWPIISISTKQPQFYHDWNGKVNKIDPPNQHLSIPPDLNIHLSPNYQFLHRDLVDDQGNLTVDFAYLFGWFSSPISNYPEPKGQWYQAELFFLNPDETFSENTGIFVELLVHKAEDEINRVLNEPFSFSKMRLISNNEAYAMRTYKFSELIRKKVEVTPNFYLSMRYGFYECDTGRTIILVKSI